MPLILVTNDDGISSPGIKILAKALKEIGDVYVVAPETEQSAVAHALTLHRPLKSLKVGNRTYCVNGTPTDCVIIGVNKILPQKPDIIVSGINNGGNLGDNITYSGTVAAAMEGTLLGIPSLAFSLALAENGNFAHAHISSKFRIAAEHARGLTTQTLKMGLPDDTLLNINIPDVKEIRGIKITKQGKLVYDNAIKDLQDPRGKECFWIGGGIPQWESGDNTDLDAVQNGYISVTPVHMNLTNYDALRYIEKNWKIR
jgi:5'-nucleotidase